MACDPSLFSDSDPSQSCTWMCVFECGYNYTFSLYLFFEYHIISRFGIIYCILLSKKELFFYMDVSHFGNTLHLETLSSGFLEVPIVGLSWPQHVLLLQRCESWGSWQIRDCQADMCSSRKTDSCPQHHPEVMACQITLALRGHETGGYHHSCFLFIDFQISYVLLRRRLL